MESKAEVEHLPLVPLAVASLVNLPPLPLYSNTDDCNYIF